MAYYTGKYDDWLGAYTPANPDAPPYHRETRRRTDALLLKYRRLNAKLAAKLAARETRKVAA